MPHTNSTLLRLLFRSFPYLPDSLITAGLPRLLGDSQYPAAKQFIARAMIALKRELRRASPSCRRKIYHNLFLNQGVYGQAQRRRQHRAHGYELPLLLVISPTMRCSLRCEGCYSAEYRRNQDLDYDTFDRVIAEAKSLGIYFFIISGGEPFLYRGIFDLFAKHSDAYFQVYTSGVTLDRETTGRLARLGNVMPCISLEGYAAETDARRGPGHFQRILTAFGNLRAARVPFGVSVTATRNNSELVVSDGFARFLADQGACVAYYFQYMPIGRSPSMDLVPTPSQRGHRFERIVALREWCPFLIIDFWNDGPLAGGCLAGGRRYLHINHKGDIEPCVFCQLSTDNLHDTSLLDALRSSRLLSAIRKRQPYSDNYLKPCMMIDVPHVLREVVEEARPHATCEGGALRLLDDLFPALEANAAEYSKIADRLWRDYFEDDYRDVVRRAHQMTRDYVRRH